uniref:Uncharacterized protein n=2 Tax=Anguilla anguilla TaxID=7936 RepID=A0A0E9S2H9_ANGAN
MLCVPCDVLATCPGCIPVSCQLHAGIGSSTLCNPDQELAM